MKKEHLSSLGPFFFLFLLPFFTCTVQPTCSRIKCMVLISCVHGIKIISSTTFISFVIVFISLFLIAFYKQTFWHFFVYGNFSEYLLFCVIFLGAINNQISVFATRLHYDVVRYLSWNTKNICVFFLNFETILRLKGVSCVELLDNS